MTEEYYLQNKNAGYLGNAPVWWAKGGNGYTAYVLGAERFTKEKAESFVKEDGLKWAMYKCEDIDARLHLVFDSQDFKNLGTDAPCGWASGYAHHTDILRNVGSDHELKQACGSFHDSWFYNFQTTPDNRAEFQELLFRFVKLWQTPPATEKDEK